MNEELLFIMAACAGAVALFGINTNHRLIGFALFLDFIFMTAYELYLIDANGFVIFPIENAVIFFYFGKMTITAAFLLLYIRLQATYLAYVSIVMLGVVGVASLTASFGVNLPLYEPVMIVLGFCQLYIGAWGVMCGNSRYHTGNLWDSITGRIFKGAKKGFKKLWR